jgi:acyl-coenzyme A synthetase/AMP-(fatty) acid ligase
MNAIVTYLKIDATERSITTLPMNYTYGLSVIHSHLHAGASLILSSKALMQKEFWAQLSERNVTSLAGVPYTYEMLDKLRFFRMNLPSLRTLTQAGGRLPERLHEKFASWAQANNKQFVVMYGQTEATARMSYLPSAQSLRKVGSIGVAIPGGRFALAPDSELIYSGDNVALGYAECADDLAKEDEFKGVLRTGDVARLDGEGFYYIVGRKKRFLKIFGKRVNLDETENLIKNGFPGIECACAGVDDKMFIFITEENLKEKIQAHISHLMELHPTAFKFIIVREIPKNEAGKVLYKELENLHV